MKFSAEAESEIKFALTFAKQIFHSEAISHYKVIFHSPQGEFH